MTLVHKITWILSVQLNKTSPAHCIVHPSPQAKSLSVPVFPHFAHLHLPLTPFPSGYPHILICVYVLYVCFCFALFLHLLSCSPPASLCSDSCRPDPCIHTSVPIVCHFVLFISSTNLLVSIIKFNQDRMV